MPDSGRSQSEDLADHALLDAILAHAPVAVIVHDRDLRIVRVSAAFHQITGYGDEVLGKSLFEFIPEPLLSGMGLKEKLPRVRDEGAVIGPEELCYRTPDGKSVVLWHLVFPLLGPDGTVKFVIALLQDMTFQKTAARQAVLLKEADETRRAMLLMLEDLNETAADLAGATRQWEETFDAITDPLFLHDRDFKIVKANRAYAEAAGEPMENVIGRPYYEVFPKTEGPLEMCLAAFKTGAQTEQEILCPLINKCFFVRFYPIKSADDRYQFSVHALEDITERKRAEEELEQAHAALNTQYGELQGTYATIEQAKKEWEATFDAISDPIFLHDKAFRIVRANQAYADAAGMPSAELIGRPYYEVFPKMEGPHPTCLKAASMQEEEEEEEEISRGRLFRLRFLPIKRGPGRLSLHILEDMTEKRQAEEEVRKLSQAVEHSPSIVMITDAQAIIEYVNPKFTEITGYAPAEVIGTSASTLGKQPPQETRQMWETITSSHEWRGEFNNRKKNGEYYWESASISAVRDAKGLIAHYIKVAEDITERKAMQTQAVRLEQLAAIGQLLGGISHEMKNPLFVLTGRLQLLKEKLAHREYDSLGSDLQKIEDAAQRMTKIAQRFLLLAKPTQPTLQECPVQDILAKVLDFLSNELMKHRIRVVREWEPALSKTQIWSDPQALHQVFLNLILNAMQAMAQAHGQGTLNVATAISNGWIEVRIQDDGPGIPPEHQARLFEPFFTTKAAGAGTGLGLWTVRVALAELKGQVIFETEVGRGTTFVVRLPLPREPFPAGDRGPAEG